MALVCTEIQEWVEEEVSKPIEEWEERQEERCKDYPWYDPRGWVCWMVTVLVKVVRWVVVTVGEWVTRTVCKLIAVVVTFVVDVVAGLWDVVVGIFTLDWRRILDGLIRIGLGIVKGLHDLLRILLLGDTVEFIIDKVNRHRLREHVRQLLEERYDGDTLDRIKDAIRLDHGAFGLRVSATAYRTVLDSETPSPADPAVPNLVALHELGAIDLRELCGFEFTEGFWNRKRYKTLKKRVRVTGGGGIGEFHDPISSDELDTYLDSRGAEGPAFVVLAMTDTALETKLDTASERGRQLGLMFSWQQERLEVVDADHIVHPGFDTGRAGTALTSLLDDEVGRTRRSVDATAARAQLCDPVAVGAFRYTDSLRGLANVLDRSACGLGGSDNSGVAFIDNLPDKVWKYVLVHELGHYVGLCHVDGVDRIMVSTRENSLWSWWAVPNLLYLRGEPIFTLDEAKAAWNHLVTNLDASCLGAGSTRLEGEPIVVAEPLTGSTP